MSTLMLPLYKSQGLLVDRFFARRIMPQAHTMSCVTLYLWISCKGIDHETRIMSVSKLHMF